MAGLAEGRREGQTDRELTVWEDQQWVRQLLESLPPMQRTVMALVVDEFTPAQVAEMLGKTPAAVRQTLRSARKHLKGKLREEDTEA
jgi:RNA polymerase sigma factor (sigma-70 family)